MNKNYVTRDGLESLKGQLAHLVSVEAKEAIEMIAEARDKGDLSENAEYEAAKAYQENVQIKISNLSDKISRSEVISTPTNTDQVEMLTIVKLKNHSKNIDVEWSLVPENEINIREGKISFNSPVASALIGKKVGEIVEVEVPVGNMRLEVLGIRPYS
jgi:transcription elongation factor GreA